MMIYTIEHSEHYAHPAELIGVATKQAKAENIALYKIGISCRRVDNGDTIVYISKANDREYSRIRRWEMDG